MCGIVGLHLRDPGLYPRLGVLLAAMLIQMSERGPDSAGVAVYGDRRVCPAGHAAVSVLLPHGTCADDIKARLSTIPDLTVTPAGATVVLAAPVSATELLGAVRAALPAARVVGSGTDLAVYKGIGPPGPISPGPYDLASAQGWQGLGHTRMATESAVTPEGCHPFSVGPDQCLVHNGSFANHATIRRDLRAAGVEFDSENDSEVGARFVAHRLERG